MAFLLVSAFVLASVQDAPVPTVSRLESDFLSQRRQITSGIVRVNSTFTYYQNGAKAKESATKSTVWFDGEKIRRDVRHNYDQPPGTTDTTYREITCLADDRYISWTDRVLADGGKVVVDLTTDVKLLAPADLRQTYNPRLLGTSPVDSFNLAQASLETTIGRSDRSPPTLRSVRWRNLDCWKIEYSCRNGLSVRAWVAPERGNSFVRLEALRHGERSADTAESSIECDVKPVAGTNFWFPVRYVYESKLNGQLVRSEVAQIEIEKLNKRLDPQVFSPLDMDIPAGTYVQSRPADPRGTLVWDGKNFVPAKALQRGPGSNGPTAFGTERRVLLLAASVGLALVGSFASYRYFRKPVLRSP